MEILERFNITPHNLGVYQDAFSHSSYANETRRTNNYERLEFLGDTVLDLAISDYLYNHTNYEEGKMTKLRASYVCENALYEYSMKLHLSDYIKLGHGEELSGGKYRKTILADIFEAFIGAIYIDQGYEPAKKIIFEVVIPYIESGNTQFLNDYKSILQELVQTNQRSVDYELISESGPSHSKVFTVVVKVDDIVLGKGSASSKKEAEQEAAKNAMEKLAKVE
jgi:ribonuclease-3